MNFNQKIRFEKKPVSAISATIAVVVIIVIVVAVVAGAYVLLSATTTTTPPTSSSSTTSSSTTTTASSSTTSSTSTSAASSATTSSSTALTSSNATTTNAAGCTSTGSPYQIGVIEPLTGALGSLGKEIYNGADLAAAQWNSTGGIPDSNGVCHIIKLILEDGGPDTTNIALQSAQTLVGMGVQVIIGPCCSADVGVIGSYLLQHKIVMISSSATAGFITTNYTSTPRYIYRTVPSDNLQTVAVASIILAKGYHHVEAVVSNEPYGLGIGNGLAAALANASGVTVKVVPFNTGASAYSTYPTVVQGIISDHPDVILYSGFIQDLVVLWKDVYQAGSLNNVPTMGVEGELSTTFFPYGRGNSGPCAGGNCPTNDSTIASYMGNTSMTGTATLSITNSTQYSTFQSSYQSDYGISCANGGCLFAPETYDAAYLAFKAIKQAGSYNGTAIAQQMISASQGYVGASGAKTFDANGDVTGPYSIWKVEYNASASGWTFATVGDWVPPNILNCHDSACGGTSTSSASTSMLPAAVAIDRSFATSYSLG